MLLFETQMKEPFLSNRDLLQPRRYLIQVFNDHKTLKVRTLRLSY